METNGGHGHDAGSRCLVCASIVAAARRARRLRGERNTPGRWRRTVGRRPDRVWEAVLLGHLWLVPGVAEEDDPESARSRFAS